MASWRRNNKPDEPDSNQQSLHDWITSDDVSHTPRSSHESESSDSLSPRPDHVKKGMVLLVSGLLAGVLLLIAVFTMFSVVPTKQVGIPVTFGKPGAPVANGLHIKAPWTQMVKMDATIQSLDATGESATIAKDVDKADVMVHNNVRWAIEPEAADSLYRDYRDFENVGDSLVQPALRTSIAAVMSSYNPLGEKNPSNGELAEKIKVDLQDRVGDRIKIDSVSVTLLDFAEATKDRINALNTERGNTRIATQRQETARAEAEANRILSESVAKDPNVLVSRCLDLLSEGRQVPAGFQCWPGQADTSGVIVDGTKPSQ